LKYKNPKTKTQKRKNSKTEEGLSQKKKPTQAEEKRGSKVK
jgi:hypothetical protein